LFERVKDSTREWLAAHKTPPLPNAPHSRPTA
jgi:hypothetical protein